MNKNITARTVTRVLVLLLILLVAGFLYKKYQVAPDVDFNKITLSTLEGKPVNLKDFADKKLFINFFATWCGPCMMEMPSLVNAQAALKNENFLFISVSDEPLNKLQALQDRIGAGLVILHSEKKLTDLKVFTIPTSYLLNKNGKVVLEKIGDEDWASEAVEEELRRLGK